MGSLPGVSKFHLPHGTNANSGYYRIQEVEENLEEQTPYVKKG